jgi:hypothetical protein
MKPLVPLRTRAVQSDPFCANYEAGDYVKRRTRLFVLVPAACSEKFGELYAVSANIGQGVLHQSVHGETPEYLGKKAGHYWT